MKYAGLTQPWDALSNTALAAPYIHQPPLKCLNTRLGKEGAGSSSCLGLGSAWINTTPCPLFAAF